MATLYLAQQTDTADGCGILTGCSGGTAATTVCNKEMSRLGTPGVVPVVCTLAASVKRITQIFQTKVGDLGNLATWAAGTWTVRLHVSVANSRHRVEDVYICRCTSGCVNVATIGHATFSQTLTPAATYSFSVTGAAQSPSAGDQILVIIVTQNTVASIQSATILPDVIIDTPIDLDQTMTPSAVSMPMSEPDPTLALLLTLLPDVAAETESVPSINATLLLSPTAGSVTFTPPSVNAGRFALPSAASLTMSVPSVNATDLVLPTAVTESESAPPSVTLAFGGINKLEGTPPKLRSTAPDPAIHFGAITRTPTPAVQSRAVPSVTLTLGTAPIVGTFTSQYSVPLVPTLAFGVATIPATFTSQYCVPLVPNLAIASVKTASRSFCITDVPDPSILLGDPRLAIQSVEMFCRANPQPLIVLNKIAEVQDATFTSQYSVPLVPTIVRENVIAATPLVLTMTPPTPAQDKPLSLAPSVLSLRIGEATPALAFGTKTIVGQVLRLTSEPLEVSNAEGLSKTDVRVAHCLVTRFADARCLSTHVVDAHCLAVSDAIAEATPLPELEQEEIFPIYVDWRILLCIGHLTAQEINAFQARLDLVSTPYTYLPSAQRFSNGVNGFKDAFDALSLNDQSGPVMGDMEDPWITLITWDTAHEEALAPGVTQYYRNQWSANADVQAEFARQIAAGLIIAALDVSIDPNSFPSSDNTTTTLADFKTIGAGLYNDAWFHAASKGCPKSSEYGSLGVTLIEGTTRIPTAALHLSSPVAGQDWYTADATYYRTMEAQFTSQSAAGAAMTALMAAHAIGGDAQPWIPSLYFLIPTSGWDSMVPLWTMGDPAVHRKVDNAIVDPPDFVADRVRYWSKSGFRRILSSASSSLASATGSANAFDAGVNFVEPILYPAACPPEFAANATLATNHVIGLWSDGPAERAAMYAAMFDAELDIPGAALHVNPHGFWVWDSADFYWINTPKLSWASSDAATRVKIDAARVGWEKMLGLLPAVGVGEPIGGTDATARNTWMHGANLGDAFYVAGSLQKYWTVAGGDQTGRGWNPFASIVAQYLDPLADVGVPEIEHAKAMFASNYSVEFVEALRAEYDARFN